jgi:BirA family transcriptional regulator, biotin operon repressor / biotin---[acetyl-CoA-carboxylase] ligase
MEKGDLEYQRLSIDEKKLRELLVGKGLQRLRISNPVCLASVDSTQLYMADQLRSSTEGDLVTSKVQTSGKGRADRIWISQTGGLWLTLTLRPPTSEILSEIPLMTTRAIVRAFEGVGLSGCSIKSPNDVFCRGRKIAGVLADARVLGNTSIVYLGVGININNDPSEVLNIKDISTSFKQITGLTIDLIEFNADFLKKLDEEYEKVILTG